MVKIFSKVAVAWPATYMYIYKDAEMCSKEVDEGYAMNSEIITIDTDAECSAVARPLKTDSIL